MNTNTAELLQQMIDIKKDTRAAIERKGVSVFCGMVTYPEAIDLISQTTAGTEIDFTRAGWLQTDSDSTNQRESEFINDALDYANLMWRRYGNYTSWELKQNDEGVMCRVNPYIGQEYPFTGYGLVVAPMILNYEVDYPCYSRGYKHCYSLRYVPNFDTSNTTDFSAFFYDCSALISIPLLNTSNGIDFNNMFYLCCSLKTITPINTTNSQNVARMFMYCYSLESIPKLNFSNVKGCGLIVFGCDELKDLGGFEGLKIPMDLSVCHNLTRQSLLNLFNNVYDWATNEEGLNQDEWEGDILSSGNPVLKLGETNLAKLTEDDIAIATDKGWTLV